ncbi:hypothetical protein B0J12DRAFT_290014 [Macrophomina phaseolina]|uniref:Uncharacterized protein n=1 Tax=Macrophomina phaseolina TaxID=35725 RepID=A0ABQ8GRL9_9PEZI|nr:hypothetical protein B0J12DRAFT_290014 [Macrophomina phaseolina]
MMARLSPRCRELWPILYWMPALLGLSLRLALLIYHPSCISISPKYTTFRARREQTQRACQGPLSEGSHAAGPTVEREHPRLKDPHPRAETQERELRARTTPDVSVTAPALNVRGLVSIEKHTGWLVQHASKESTLTFL